MDDPYYPTKRVDVVAGIVLRGDRVLLTQRTRDRDFPLQWECPGGKLEHGEPPGDALRRELAEEVGLHIVRVREIASFATIFHAGEFGFDCAVGLTFHACTDVPPTWRPRLRDVVGAGWFTLAEMSRLNLIPGNQRLLAHLQAAGLECV